MTLIKDPAHGTVARVGNDGRLRVDSVAQPQEAEAAHDGSAYVFGTPMSGVRTWTMPTVTDYIVAYLKNLSSVEFVTISDFIFSASAAGMYFYGIVNPVEGTLANEVAVIPQNRNFGSSKAADVEAYLWDEVVGGITGLTGGIEFASAIMPASSVPFDMQQALHLSRNNSIALGIQNPTGGPIEASLLFRFFMEQIEELQP